MQRIATLAEQVARTDAAVLIRGETGVGKEVLGRAIHVSSPRATRAFLKLDCAALPSNLVESELFGHRRGAFSGAIQDRPGRFQVANGGTILLDEIGDLPLEAQAKLLRVLQEGTFEPIGNDVSVKVDVRIIAATHVDLEDAIERGTFREDLYYRLNVFPLEMPPLRERLQDLEMIAQDILDGLARGTGRGPWTISAASIERLERYEWPGNIRELANCLERATILREHGLLELEPPLSKKSHAIQEGHVVARGANESWPTLFELERDYIERVLVRTEGRIYGAEGAAELLGMKPSTLQSRMLKLGVKRREPARMATRSSKAGGPHGTSLVPQPRRS